MSNNCYSIIINSARYGFLYSTRYLKQVDPLSPYLFILEDKVFSLMMNNLHDHHLYHSFHLEKKGPQTNHMSFADDVIILSYTKDTTLQLILGVLSDYENVFG